MPQPPRRARAAAAALLAAASRAAISHAGTAAPPVRELVAQLDGGRCGYRSEGDRCEPRPLLSLELLLRTRRHTCVYWAATCLARAGPDAREALPGLLRALRDGPNDFDTGDGTIGARSAVARALAAIGDPAAVPSLVLALENARPYDTAAITGAVRTAQPAARLAIVDALASFGTRAGDAAPALAAVLGERNAAARLAPPAGAPGGPEGVPPRLYLEDPLGEAAAAALGSVGATGAVPLLTLSLENRGAARGAAEGLGRLGPAARPAAWRLRALLSSPAYQPNAKIAAAVALARIGDGDAAPALGDALSDPSLAIGCLDALSLLGPAAGPAVPAVTRLLASPSGAVRAGNAVRWDVQATRARQRRLHAVETLGRIGTDAALAALAAVLADWEVGASACRELRRCDPGGARVRAAVSRLAPAELARNRGTRFERNPCLDGPGRAEPPRVGIMKDGTGSRR